jgi:hypothetical protein
LRILTQEKFMSTVLITGASGFIGKALAVEMARNHTVVCMSRSRPSIDLPWVRGDFAVFEDLRLLDCYPIDVVVHLGAVTGGCLERDGIMVNVELDALPDRQRLQEICDGELHCRRWPAEYRLSSPATADPG